MKSAWKVGKIAGIEFRIDSSWVVIFALFTWTLAADYFPRQHPGWPAHLYWGLGLLTSLLVFASVLFHELAHSLVARRNGEEVRSITLFILGGVAQISDEPKEPLQELGMALAGPLSSFLLAAFFLAVSLAFVGRHEPFHAAAVYLALINLALGVFNLLPGFPMDGGRVLRSIIWKATGDIRKATRVASGVGQALSFLLIVVGVMRFFQGDFGGLWLVLIGWFLHNASVRGYDQVMIKTALEGLRVRDLMSADFQTISPTVSVQSLVDDHILKKRERVFIVAEAGEPQGIVCLEDVKKTPRERWTSLNVRDIMTPKERLESVALEADGSAVLERLVTRDVHQLPVVAAGKVVGIICRNDLLKVLQLRSELGV